MLFVFSAQPAAEIVYVRAFGDQCAAEILLQENLDEFPLSSATPFCREFHVLSIASTSVVVQTDAPLQRSATLHIKPT